MNEKKNTEAPRKNIKIEAVLPSKEEIKQTHIYIGAIKSTRNRLKIIIYYLSKEN